MNLVFAGLCATFHHQYFKIVDMLAHHFERNIDLNPCATPCKPKQEVDEVVAKEENKQQEKRIIKLAEGHNFGWKLL